MYPPSIAASRPDARAYVMAGSGASLTYAELDAHSNQLSHAVRDAGIGIGGTLLIAMENRIEWPIAVAAGMRAGLYVTPVNSHLRASELAAIVAESDPDAVITSPDLAPVVAVALAEARPRLRLCVGGGADGFDDLLATLGELPTYPIPDENLGARVLYSGGSTGRPRAFRQRLLGVHPADAPVRHGILMNRLGIGADTVLLSPAPSYHAAPFTFQTAVLGAGGTVVCMERFDPAAAMAAILRHRVTLSQWVPTMLLRLLAAHRAAAERGEAIPLSPSHRTAVTSGGPCPAEVKAAIDKWWGPVLHEYYGASEGYGHTYLSPIEAREHPGSVGRPLGPVAIHVTSADAEPGDHRELAPGEIGTVWFEALRPPDYANQGEATPAEEWKTTGDLGSLDEDGYLTLHGRRGFTIVSGGVNIYPEEVEAALLRDPRVRDAAVFGEPNPEFGEQVVAVVEADDAPGIDDELIAHCRAELATFKAPRRVVVVDTMPRLPTGKLDKRRLASEHAGRP